MLVNCAMIHSRGLFRTWRRKPAKAKCTQLQNARTYKIIVKNLPLTPFGGSQQRGPENSHKTFFWKLKRERVHRLSLNKAEPGGKRNPFRAFCGEEREGHGLFPLEAASRYQRHPRIKCDAACSVTNKRGPGTI